MQITQWNDTTRTEVFKLLDILPNQGIYVTMERCFWDESVKDYRDKDGNRIDKVKLGFLKRSWYIGISTKEYYVIHSHFGEHGLQVVHDRTDFKSMDDMIQYIYDNFGN